jgi:hypothetical protein
MGLPRFALLGGKHAVLTMHLHYVRQKLLDHLGSARRRRSRDAIADQFESIVRNAQINVALPAQNQRCEDAAAGTAV